MYAMPFKTPLKMLEAIYFNGLSLENEKIPLKDCITVMLLGHHFMTQG